MNILGSDESDRFLATCFYVPGWFFFIYKPDDVLFVWTYSTGFQQSWPDGSLIQLRRCSGTVQHLLLGISGHGASRLHDDVSRRHLSVYHPNEFKLSKTSSTAMNFPFRTCCFTFLIKAFPASISRSSIRPTNQCGKRHSAFSFTTPKTKIWRSRWEDPSRLETREKAAAHFWSPVSVFRWRIQNTSARWGRWRCLWFACWRPRTWRCTSTSPSTTLDRAAPSRWRWLCG